MMYPYTVVEPNAPNNIYTVDPGSMLVFELHVPEGSVQEIITQHVAVGIQDHSLRLWVSNEIGGQTLGKAAAAFWHPNRTPRETVKVYDEEIEAPEGTSIALTPGSYYLCVLNLVNSRNALSYHLTVLT